MARDTGKSGCVLGPTRIDLAPAARAPSPATAGSFGILPLRQNMPTPGQKYRIEPTILGEAIKLHRKGYAPLACGGKIPQGRGAIRTRPKRFLYRSARGDHRLFRRPAGLPENAVIKVQGIEFRGCGSNGK